MRISLKLPLVVFGLLVAALMCAAAPAMAELKLQRFAISAQNENGSPDVQAGSHPYALTTTFLLHEAGASTGDLKNVKLELPPGFVGDPTATPRCSYQEFIKATYREASCAPETAVGVSSTYLRLETGEIGATTDPVYNLVPPPGVAAEFGFIVAHETPVLLETSVRTGGDYGLTTTVPGVNQAVVVAASKVTIWGVPASPAHNLIRGSCVRSYGEPETAGLEEIGDGLREGEDELEGPIGPYKSRSLIEPSSTSPTGCVSLAKPLPLLTNPTSCGTPRTATLSVDDWEEPGNFTTGEHVSSKTVSLPELSGCEKLDFSPSLEVKPDGTAGSTPTGLNIGLHVPQASTESPESVAEADVKDTTVTLPAGVQLNPSAADGLQACTGDPADPVGTPGNEIGFERVNPETGAYEFSPRKPGSIPAVQAGEEAGLQPGVNFCPEASKVANVKIKTPLLEKELTGAVYLAAPQNFLAGPLENPFGSLFALYLVAEEPERGVLVKLPGKVVPSEATGQLTTTFENTPQLPFSDLQLEFYGTERAPLATPALCGSYKTETSFASWSGETRNPSAEFSIGSHCTAPGQALPFSPTLSTGVPNINAGSFSSLTTTFSREDGQQDLSGITLHYPPGLSGILAGVPLCGEAEANAGTCGAGSLIGETIVSVGLGGDPFSVTGGKVYLTGPYDGAPFGLSIVNPAKAGPFDLQEGRPVIVRAKIEVDPHTAALTVTTTNEIPHIIDGIPLQIKHVNVNITRPGFTFNPTSCDPMSVTGTITSVEGASSSVSDPFQVTNCQALKFTPKFSVSTTGHTSKKLGAGLTAKVTEPAGALGTQANIARVKVDLPIKLPSQLKTLQKACPAKVFEEGFQNCLDKYKNSKVGEAVVYTPLLPVPLKGPAIFVSHGGEAFPSLTIVLQGYGVTVDLVGATDIKKGITSTTFKTVPDVPFTSFELNLPQGEFAALASNLPEADHGNLCGQNLKMPTEFLAQNGTKINEDTTIGTSGCAKVKALTRAQKLQKALKACRKDKGKAKRATCEAKAHKEYGPVNKSKKKVKKK